MLGSGYSTLRPNWTGVSASSRVNLDGRPMVECHGCLMKVRNIRIGVDDRSMLDIRVEGNKVRDEGEMI